ncbi:uncharacterized protein G2W53_041080 [Senna tora]|uniref:Uncharacterized protein n=1 Tax=Senna tora TaxID=362788 RepID=A0A834SEM3_9FABA|nr:uncharacterized protein G2W53_041080 [Senna tora]
MSLNACNSKYLLTRVSYPLPALENPPVKVVSQPPLQTYFETQGSHCLNVYACLPP